MKSLFEHIEHVRSKPHQVRRRVAFSLATGTTAFIGVVWLGASLATGSFAIKGSNFADSAGVVPVERVSGDTSQLAGAAAARSATGGPARIQIVTVSTSTPAEATADQTVIPF